jgi:hypothetical protein
MKALVDKKYLLEKYPERADGPMHKYQKYRVISELILVG